MAGEAKRRPLGLGTNLTLAAPAPGRKMFVPSAPLGLSKEFQLQVAPTLLPAHPASAGDVDLVPPPSIAQGVAYDRFKRDVLRLQIEWHQSRGLKYSAPIPTEQLHTVEGKVKMRSAAASKCKELLKAARDAAKAEDKKLTIGVASGYRDVDYDRKLWHAYYPKYYAATRPARKKLRGGEHGEAAAQLLARYIRGKKAAPGFSNHSNGKAVDFRSTEGGITVGPSTDQREAWRKAWFYKWLQKNASKFQFKQLPTEEWHWDYQG